MGTNPTTSPRAFYLRRFTRIYPTYFFIWVLVLVLPIIAGPKNLSEAVVNLLLLQAWSWRNRYVFSMNGVSWSLSCEMFFYAIFPLVYVATQRLQLRTQWLAAGSLFAAAGTVVVIGSVVSPSAPLALIAGANPLVRLPEFLLGVVAARHLQSGRSLSYWTFLPAIVFALVGLACAHGSPTASTWAAPSFMLVVFFVAKETIAGREVLAHRWLVYAGKVSFPFYLVHQIVIKETFHAFHAGIGQAVLALIFASGLAVALHEAVELPAQRAIAGGIVLSRRARYSSER